ncbi:MAG: EscV/YscV/HrcV family type III secretion system export apparatus protein, partial [Mesorhizobium sp.]
VILGLMPGLPLFPFFALAGGMAGLGYVIPMRQNRAMAAAEALRDEEKAKKAEEEKNSVKASLATAEIELLIGKQLSTRLLVSHQELVFRMAKMRKKFAQQYGFVVPEVRVADDFAIPPK